jgi:hypothetical protein
MNDSDILARAAQALREAHTGERAASGFTRARIMNTLHRERRRRILRWAVFSPLVSVLLVGSAWAQSTGNWPVIWRAVSSVFSAAPDTREPTSRQPASRRELGTRAPGPVETPAPAPPEPALEPKTPEPVAEVTPPAERAATSAPERRRRPSRAVRARPRPVPDDTVQKPAAEPAAPAAARELASFRAAHDLHFRGDRPREAIAAYEAYLREYPRGRFVPEARYNSALDRIKLGERAAAREALAPFAAGEYGGYRQQEASELLGALR